MLLAYGFPPFPYPIPPGVDPAIHVHMIATDPTYKARYDKDRAEKEKAFKDQIDRDNREKDRRAGVKIPSESPAGAASPSPKHTISVKHEFRETKKELKQEPPAPPPAKKVEEEGIKPTMETRGPPPATTPSLSGTKITMIMCSVIVYILFVCLGLLHPALLGRPFGPYDPAALAGLNPQILASLYAAGAAGAAAGPYGVSPQQMQQMLAAAAGAGGPRPPGFPPTSLPEDLSRAMAASLGKQTYLNPKLVHLFTVFLLF